MDQIITATDVLEAGYCINKGLKPFLKRNKIDYINFLKNGMLVEDAKKYDNLFINRIIENKYGKQ